MTDLSSQKEGTVSIYRSGAPEETAGLGRSWAVQEQDPEKPRGASPAHAEPAVGAALFSLASLQSAGDHLQ